MNSGRSAGSKDGPASADANYWARLDILVETGLAGRLPAMVAALRAAGHRVRVATSAAPADAIGEDDLPDLVVAEIGSAGVDGVAGIVGQDVPIVHADLVQSALEGGRVGDLLGPFDLGRMA